MEKTFDEWRKSREEESVSSRTMSLHDRERVRVVSGNGEWRERGE